MRNYFGFGQDATTSSDGTITLAPITIVGSAPGPSTGELAVVGSSGAIGMALGVRYLGWALGGPLGALFGAGIGYGIAKYLNV